jgi:hypothetical protein
MNCDDDYVNKPEKYKCLGNTIDRNIFNKHNGLFEVRISMVMYAQVDLLVNALSILNFIVNNNKIKHNFMQGQ